MFRSSPGSQRAFGGLQAELNAGPSAWGTTRVDVKYHRYNGKTPVKMTLRASTGPVMGRCCQHRTSRGPVLATNGMFTGNASHLLILCLIGE